MYENFEINKYSKVGSVIMSTYLLLELYHPNWYSYSSIGKYMIYMGAPLWIYGLYKTLPNIINYYTKD